MNPASASMPATPRQMVNDVAAPARPPAAPASPVPSAPSIVNNIPVHNQAAPAPATNEDAELDMIMHEVGQEIKKEDKKPTKHSFLNFGHKSKPKSAFSAPPVARQPQPVAAMPVPPPAAAQAQPMSAVPAAQTQAAPATVKAKAKRSVPVFAIFVALLVTGFLTAAAIAAYRQA
jgi:hypothetical protein